MKEFLKEKKTGTKTVDMMAVMRDVKALKLVALMAVKKVDERVVQKDAMMVDKMVC